MEELKIIFKQKVFLYQTQTYHCGEPSKDFPKKNCIQGLQNLELSQINFVKPGWTASFKEKKWEMLWWENW
jgi:hypothetical protein